MTDKEDGPVRIGGTIKEETHSAKAATTEDRRAVLKRPHGQESPRMHSDISQHHPYARPGIDRHRQQPSPPHLRADVRQSSPPQSYAHSHSASSSSFRPQMPYPPPLPPAKGAPPIGEPSYAYEEREIHRRPPYGHPMYERPSFSSEAPLVNHAAPPYYVHQRPSTLYRPSQVIRAPGPPVDSLGSGPATSSSAGPSSWSSTHGPPVVRGDQKQSDSSPVCSNCSTTQTPLWRRDGKGGLLCELFTISNRKLLCASRRTLIANTKLHVLPLPTLPMRSQRYR